MHSGFKCCSKTVGVGWCLCMLCHYNCRKASPKWESVIWGWWTFGCDWKVYHYMLFCFSLMQILYIAGLLIVNLLTCVHSQGRFHHRTIFVLHTHCTRGGYQPDVITHDDFCKFNCNAVFTSVTRIFLWRWIFLGPFRIAYKVKYSEGCQSVCR